MSVKSAINCAKAVMWSGPHQGAIFVVWNDVKGGPVLMDYDELQMARLQYGDLCFVDAVVVPGEHDGECIIL